MSRPLCTALTASPARPTAAGILLHTRKTLKEKLACCSEQPALKKSHLSTDENAMDQVPVALRKRNGGRDVAKSFLPLLVVTLASVLAGAQNVAPISGESLLDRPPALVGSALTCSQSQALRIPASVAGRARIKAQLLNLLRESLYDDAKGIVNIAREKEIRKLASKIRDGKSE